MECTTTRVANLASELLSRVFLHLDMLSLTQCRLVSQEFNEIITNDLRLQYMLKLALHDMVDDRRVVMPVHEKLESLGQFVKCWDNFEWSNPTMIDLFQNGFGTDRSSGSDKGVFVFRDGNSFHCIQSTQPVVQPWSFTIAEFTPDQCFV
ncbi:hypothetical protein BDN72DRAFT_835795, partial [Pluteus cervinus]